MATHEPMSNIGFVCAEHAPKAGGFTDIAPEKFIGIFVKRAFSCPNGMIEHMWVKIEEVRTIGDEPVLIGHLSQDPVYAELKDGDMCEVRRAEIEDVFRG